MVLLPLDLLTYLLHLLMAKLNQKSNLTHFDHAFIPFDLRVFERLFEKRLLSFLYFYIFIHHKGPKFKRAALDKG
jgi:hypothetical protein